MAMRAARPHFRSIRRKPTDFQPFAHSHLREKLAEQQNTLAAEARNLDRVLAEMMRMFGELRMDRFVLRADFQDISDDTLRGRVVRGGFRLAVAEDIERESRNRFLGDPVAGVDRILPPDSRTGRKNLNKKKTQAV